MLVCAALVIGASVVTARADRLDRGAAASGVRHHLRATLVAVQRSRSAKQSRSQCVSPSDCAPFARPKFGEEFRAVVEVKQRAESPKEI